MGNMASLLYNRLKMHHVFGWTVGRGVPRRLKLWADILKSLLYLQTASAEKKKRENKRNLEPRANKVNPLQRNNRCDLKFHGKSSQSYC